MLLLLLFGQGAVFVSKALFKLLQLRRQFLATRPCREAFRQGAGAFVAAGAQVADDRVGIEVEPAPQEDGSIIRRGQMGHGALHPVNRRIERLRRVLQALLGHQHAGMPIKRFGFAQRLFGGAIEFRRFSKDILGSAIIAQATLRQPDADQRRPMRVHVAHIAETRQHLLQALQRFIPEFAVQHHLSQPGICQPLTDALFSGARQRSGLVKVPDGQVDLILFQFDARQV